MPGAIDIPGIVADPAEGFLIFFRIGIGVFLRLHGLAEDHLIHTEDRIDRGPYLMARVGKKIRLRFTCTARLFERMVLLDLRLHRLILCDRTHDDIGKIHHGETRIVGLRELVSRLTKRRAHIDDHDQEHDHVKV